MEQNINNCCIQVNGIQEFFVLCCNFSVNLKLNQNKKLQKKKKQRLPSLDQGKTVYQVWISKKTEGPAQSQLERNQDGKKGEQNFTFKKIHYEQWTYWSKPLIAFSF